MRQAFLATARKYNLRLASTVNSLRWLRALFLFTLLCVLVAEPLSLFTVFLRDCRFFLVVYWLQVA